MASFSNSGEETPQWLELPPEITAMILQKLYVVEILTTAEKVCPTWQSVCRDPAMWRRIDMYGFPCKYKWKKMCREAVDRSQGQLIDINIHLFGSDNLLLYISQRCPDLKRLRLEMCESITDKGLSEAIKNFPLLEELHLYYSPAGIETIKSVGRHCPRLKSFKVKTWCNYPQLHDLEVLAIAENMPELIHLQLIGNDITNEGVQAILEGCTHLESLDLRQCFNVDLKGFFGQLCQHRIKNLRQPNDATYGYEFGFLHRTVYSDFDSDYMFGDFDLEIRYDSDYD